MDEFEYVYVFLKPGISIIDRSRLARDEWSEWGSRAVWYIPSVHANVEHEAQFPVKLAQRIIRLFSAPDDLVLDCFIGGGTTAIAAITEGRRYIGFELLDQYAKLAEKRCKQAPVSYTHLTLPTKA